MSDILTTRDVCATFKVSRETIRRWINAGQLVPLRKLPGRHGAYLFEAAEVARLRDRRAA